MSATRLAQLTAELAFIGGGRVTISHPTPLPTNLKRHVEVTIGVTNAAYTIEQVEQAGADAWASLEEQVVKVGATFLPELVTVRIGRL
jgi:hypothetical protein